MEIISFVQNKPAVKKFNLPLFHKSRTDYSSGGFDVFNTQIKSFTVKKVYGPVTSRNFLLELGHKVTLGLRFAAENSKKAAAVFFISACAVLIASGLYRISSVFQNYTGPVKLPVNGGDSIENLNKLMSSFALEASDSDDSDALLNQELASKVSVSITQPVSYQNYSVKAGDTISGIAKKFGLTYISTLISVNDIGNVRQLCAGQKLKIPSIDGILYTVKKGDSINLIADSKKISLKQLLDVNELTSEVLTPGQQIFLPGAVLDQKVLKDALGERFILPISAKFRWSSPYGTRIDPIAGVKSFHTGTDMACPTGTPILAAMSGKVITTGVNRIYGNYVIIDHQNGYQTLYAHMSKIIAAKGQWVSQGTRIGLVGSTGYSTGPHLHFTVYKNGKMINPMTILK